MRVRRRAGESENKRESASESLEFRVWKSTWSRDLVLGFRFSSSRIRFRFSGFGFRDSGFVLRFSFSGFPGFMTRVSDSWSRIPGSGFRVTTLGSPISGRRCQDHQLWLCQVG